MGTIPHTYLYMMINENMDLKDYYNFMKDLKRKSGYNYDELVSIWAKPYLKR